MVVLRGGLIGEAHNKRAFTRGLQLAKQCAPKILRRPHRELPRRKELHY